MFSCCCVFFFKQKTAYEMRISDWSSDVCSSDLHRRFLRQRRRAKRGGDRREAGPSLHLVFPAAARFIARAYSPVTPIAFMPTTSSALNLRYPAAASPPTSAPSTPSALHAIASPTSVSTSASDVRPRPYSDRKNVVKGKSGAVRDTFGGCG